MSARELITKLEAATGPSRELDGAIWCAVNGLEFHSWDGAGCVWRDPGIRHQSEALIRHFTASIDAALTLVPADVSWEMDCWPTGRAKFHASCGGGGRMGLSNATPALALCIAALKARS